MSDPAAIYEAITDEASSVLISSEEILEGLTISVLTRGHVLLEGVPGVAKTTIAEVFARATGLQSNRIQMTPDILPADITGSYMYRESANEFELRRGPIFANIVIADEINRATPKTQSALLEAMQERHVTIEGSTLDLPTPFIVIATQNPIEMEGTFSLPEAQRDRFMLKLTVDLPSHEDERELISRFDSKPELGPDSIDQVVTRDELLSAREIVTDVHVDEKVSEYILRLVGATRGRASIDHGASPRATLALLHGSKARAAIHGREYAIPDDVKALVAPVLRHRLVLSTDAELSGDSTMTIIEDILETVDVPEMDTLDTNGSQPIEAPDGGHNQRDEA